MRFYVLKQTQGSVGAAVTDFLEAPGSLTGEAPRCQVCGNFVGMRPLLPPVRVQMKAWGETWGDVAFGVGDQIVVSEKFSSAFHTTGLRGIQRLDPVRVVRVAVTRQEIPAPPTYSLATIQRGSALIDDFASALVRELSSFCPSCRAGLIKRASRIVIQDGTWSGEDLFFARGLPGVVIASESMRRLCIDYDLQNCSFVAAEEFSFDFYPEDVATEYH